MMRALSAMLQGFGLVLAVWLTLDLLFGRRAPVKAIPSRTPAPAQRIASYGPAPGDDIPTWAE